jgi:hypothetical protein
LVELDVIGSMALGLNLNKLIEIYKTQFHVLSKYESETYYDSAGKIVFTPNRGLPGVGFPRKGKGRGENKEIGWEDICDMTSGTVSRTLIDDTLPDGPHERTIAYEAPFARYNRVEDYRVAWEFFEREGVGA